MIYASVQETKASLGARLAARFQCQPCGLSRHIKIRPGQVSSSPEAGQLCKVGCKAIVSSGPEPSL